MRILALDVGTSSVKAAVLEQSAGLPLGQVIHQTYPLEQPELDAAVIDPEKLRNAVFAAAKAAARGFNVEGIGLSCMAPGLILLGKGEKPLTPIITHLDRRARPEAREIEATVGAEFLGENGNRPLPGGISGVVFRHLARATPELRSQVRRYLHLNGWLGLLLTGQYACDPANACFSGLCAALKSFSWSPRWCDYFGVKPHWLPPIRPGEEEFGTLEAEVARELGLTPGIPVKLGTADTSSAMLAARLGAGGVLHVVGTTQVLATLTLHPQPDPRRLTRPFGVGSAFLHVTHNPVGGVALDWLHQLCFRDQNADLFYRETIPQAQRHTTSVKLEPPFLGGDRLEIDARFASWTGLSLSTDRMDLLASLLEGMKEGHRQAWANLGLSHKPNRIVLTGGGADAIAGLLPEYAGGKIERIEQASLRGVARLFD
jgi:sugar (pentulose or hexulose) kinase